MAFIGSSPQRSLAVVVLTALLLPVVLLIFITVSQPNKTYENEFTLTMTDPTHSACYSKETAKVACILKGDRLPSTIHR